MGITAERLDKALRAAGVPIVGVSVGNDADPGTWSIQFNAPATQEQRDQGAAILAAYVSPSASVLEDETAQRDTNRKELQAVALGLWECIPAPTMTKAQLKNRIVAIYKTLP